MSRYAQEFDRSLSDPEGFWGDAAKLIEWYEPPAVVLDRSRAPFYRWFAGGVLNTCFNAVDRHVRDGRGQQPALIYDSPVTGTRRRYTYAGLLDETARFAGVLRGQALGLFLYAFGIFTVWILIAAFRTNVMVVAALTGLAATLFVLGAGNYNGNGLLVETGGYMGLVVAALAAYIGLAELCEITYKRSVLPLFPLAKH